MYAIILKSIYLFLYIEKVHLKKKKKDSIHTEIQNVITYYVLTF